MEKAKLLIVEDDGVIAAYLKSTLEHFGYTVAGLAPSGEEAVELAQSLKPDLVLMDIRLAGQIDGIEAALRIQSQRPTPVVYLTAYADPQIIERAKETHPYGYLTKPIEDRVLYSTVEIAISKFRMEQQIRANEKRHIAVLEQLSDGIILLDAKTNQVLEVNQAMLNLTGLSRKELETTDLPSSLGHNLMTFQDGLKEIKDEGEFHPREGRYRRKDGSFLDLEMSASRIQFNDESLICIVIRDIRERKKAAAAIENQFKRLRTIRAVEISIAASIDLKLTLRILLEQLVQHLGVDAADVMLLDQNTNILAHASDFGFRATELPGLRINLGDGMAGSVARHRRPIHIEELNPTMVSERDRILWANEDIKAYSAYPLISRGRVKGVMELFYRKPVTLEDDLDEYLSALAGQAAIAIDNASLYEEMQVKNNQLLIAYESTIEGLAQAMDMREDLNNSGHSHRVVEQSLKLAQYLGLSGDQLVHIRRGALLHDIGKMGIPDEVLKKIGPLNEQEWKLIRKHPEIAYHMLEPIDFLKPALIIPYCHHERWDGSGYPRGLKGEEIPFEARLFSVIDVWDALLSEKPYRPAWNKEHALSYIRGQAGKQFDPRIVTVFGQMIEAEFRR